MADFIPPSAGEAGGIFAGVVAVTGLVGSGVAWLFGRRKAGAEADDFDASAKLKRTQAKHIEFKELTETVAVLVERMNAAEHDLRECKTRESDQAARMDRIERRQRMLLSTLRSAWPLDHSIPPDMLDMLDRIEAEINVRAEREVVQPDGQARG